MVRGCKIQNSHCMQHEGPTNDNVAVPHAEVEISDFYKLISQDLPEPRRMKQLLTWCATRALPSKPTGMVEGTSAIMAGTLPHI